MVRNFDTVTSAPARTAEPTTSNVKSKEIGATNARQSGKAAPSDGQGLPPVASPEAPDMARAAERLNQLAREAARDLQFRVDDSTGRTVIMVVNSVTGEVVRQIPAEEVLSISRSLTAFGAIIDAKI